MNSIKKREKEISMFINKFINKYGGNIHIKDEYYYNDKYKCEVYQLCEYNWGKFKVIRK